MAPAKRTTGPPPAFQFYPSDFLNSPKVRRMSMTERGVYITLLCLDWMDGGLPLDINLLAKDINVKPSQLRSMFESSQLGQCFSEENGRYRNDRLIRERKKQAEFKRRQTDNGNKGGRPKKTHSKPTGFEMETQTENPRVNSGKARALKTEEEERSNELVQEREERLDVEFRRFQAEYPEGRRKGGRMLEGDYLSAVEKAGSAAALLAALQNHIASEQWSKPHLIPGMDVWLREERWVQRLPAAGAVASSAANPKTAGNIPALQRFIDRGKKAVNE